MINKLGRSLCVQLFILSVWSGATLYGVANEQCIDRKDLSISPETLDVEPGVNVTILCTIRREVSNRSVHELRWSISYPLFSNILSNSSVDIVNSTTTSLVLPNLTFTDTNYYFCYFEEDTHACITPGVNSDIQVGLTPTGATDIQCRAVNTLSFYCWWTPGRYTHFTMLYELYYESNDGEFVRCVNQNRRGPEVPDSVNTHCYRRNGRSVPLDLRVKVQENNTIGKVNKSAVFQFDRILKPNPVEDLRFSQFNQTHIEVISDRPNDWSFIDGDLIFRTEIRLNGADRNGSFDSMGDTEGQSLDRLIGNLQPNTKYIIRVAAMPDSHGRGLQSEWVEIVANTLPAKPEGSVQHPRTQFFNNEKYTRDVRILWEGIPEENENGPNFRYKIMLANKTATLIYETLDDFYYIPGINKFEEYTAVIVPVNDIGEGIEASLLIRNLANPTPSKAYDLQVHALSESEVELTWEEPRSPRGLIKGFTVEWHKEGASHMNSTHFVDMVQGQVNFSYVVQFLHTFEYYKFCVSTQSLISNALGSETCQDGRTLPGPPIVAPGGVEVTSSENPHQLTVTWRPLLAPHRGNMRGNVVYYCQTAKDSGSCIDGYKSKEEYGEGSVSSILEDLEPFTEYQVLVAAFFEEGEGPLSHPHRHITPQGRPTPPLKVAAKHVNSSTIKLSWSPPENMNGIFKTYTVSYTTDPQRDGDQKINKTTNRSITLKVQGFQSYSIKVRAESHAADMWNKGIWSEILNVTTPVGAAKEVEKLTISRNDRSGEITLAWGEPEESNGPITYYAVSYYATDNAEEPKEFFVTHKMATIEISCPRNGEPTTYEFSVWAVTEDISSRITYSGLPVTRSFYMCEPGGLSVKTVLPGVLIPATILVFILTIYVWKCQSDIKKSIPEPFFVEAVLTSMNGGTAWGHKNQQFFIIEKECFDPLRGVDDSTKLLSPGLDRLYSKESSNTSTSTDQGIQDMDAHEGEPFHFFQASSTTKLMEGDVEEDLGGRRAMRILSEDYDEDAVFDYAETADNNDASTCEYNYKEKHVRTPPNSPVSLSTSNLSSDQTDSGNGSGTEYSKLSEMQPLMASSLDATRPVSVVSDDSSLNYMRMGQNVDHRSAMKNDANYIAKNVQPLKSNDSNLKAEKAHCDEDQKTELDPLNGDESDKPDPSGGCPPYVASPPEISDYSTHMDVSSPTHSESDSEKDINANRILPGDDSLGSKNAVPGVIQVSPGTPKVKGQDQQGGKGSSPLHQPISSSVTDGEEYSVLATEDATQGSESKVESPYVAESDVIVRQPTRSNDGYLSCEDLAGMRNEMGVADGQQPSTEPTPNSGYLPHYVAASKDI